MTGEIETLKRIKEAEDDAAKRIAEAEEGGKKLIEEANAYSDKRIAEAVDAGKKHYEDKVAEATAKASVEAKAMVDDAKARAKGIKHLDPDEALEIFEKEALDEFGV